MAYTRESLLAEGYTPPFPAGTPLKDRAALSAGMRKWFTRRYAEGKKPTHADVQGALDGMWGVLASGKAAGISPGAPGGSSSLNPLNTSLEIAGVAVFAILSVLVVLRVVNRR